MKFEDRVQSLTGLQQRIRACRQCLEAGYQIFPRPIFSGTATARIMVIGQAPGITEKEAGRPFNAGSGTRLFHWLAQAGIDETWFRSTQYMCSVTRCYPGRARAGSGDRAPSSAEQQLCRPYLTAELALVDPALILPVGRLAIRLFYAPDLSLDKIIGTKKQVDGRWIIPLPHPSGASRWHQTEDNRQRVQQAIDLIKFQYRELFSA
jgi:uracil-DNA glycosylase